MPYCEVQTVNGVPTVVVDGAPVFLMANKNGPQEKRYYEQFRDAGFLAYVTNNKIPWDPESPYDYSELDGNLARILEADPEGYILIELHCNAPAWWEEQHAGELQVSANGMTFGQSMGSELWLAECGHAVRKCVEHVEERFPRNVIGYFVGAAHTYEWFYKGAQLRYLVDYSEPMRLAFGRWLSAKYGDDLGDVEIPSRYEALQTDVFSFRDPERRRRVLDFYEFCSHLMTQNILHFARIVKEACKGEKLFGVFYGHTLDWVQNPCIAQHTGHLALAEIIDAPEIDLFAGPNSYLNRSVGGQAPFVAAADSLKLHGKLWFAESDTRTHIADPVQDLCGRPDSLEDSLLILKRDFANVLIHGVDTTWFSLHDGWYDHPEMMALFAKMRKIADKAFRTDRRSAAEIALVIDEESLLYQSLRDSYIVDPFISQEPRAADLMARIGTDHDVILLSDLRDERTWRYKVYVFANAYHVPSDLRDIIKTKLFADGNHLVWIYAPGFVGDDLSVANMQDLTGLRFGLLEVSSEIFIRITNFESPFTSGDLDFGTIFASWVNMDFENHFGVNKPVGPIFYCDDPEATFLGEYTTYGHCGFAAKTCGDATSIFVGTPFVPPLLLRKIARNAGLHLYNDADDILYANRNFLCVHSKHAGERTLAFPKPVTVYDVFDEAVAAHEQDALLIDYPQKLTKLYYYGDVPWEEL